MKTSEYLYNTAEYISEHGWTRNKYIDEETGAVCLVGALARAEGNEIYALGAPAIRDYLGIRYFSIWNDNIAKDADEVIHMLKLVAEQEAIKEDNA